MSNASDFIIEKGVLRDYRGPGGDIAIPDGVKEIGTRVFQRRDDLTGVSFPKSLKKIGARAFEGCGQLTEILIPEGVKKIDKSAFSFCRKVSRLVLPTTLKTIEEWAFQSCGMEEINLPEGVEFVQPTAFAECSSVKRITIPASLRWFDWDSGFHGGGSLECFEVSPDNPCLSSRDGVLFSKEGTLNFAYPTRWNDGVMLIRYPTGRKGDYAIPDGVTIIGLNAFRSCSALTGITFPEGITEIAGQAFHGCDGLTSVTLPASLRILGGFGWCKNLKAVALQEGLSSIGGFAFAYCRDLKEIYIPDSVTSIGEGAFDECSCLIRTSHWTQMLADAVKNRDSLRQKGTDDLRFLTDDPISVFPANRRRQALLGFIEEAGTDYSSERAKTYLDYAKKNAGKLVETAFENPKLLSILCEHKLIGAKDLDIYLDKAEKRGDAEKKALLLDYQNTIGTKEVAKARAKKEKVKEDYTDALAERIVARDPSKGIAGMTFVITGKLNAWPKVWENRNEVKEYLENNGAFLGSSVTKKTDYLVTNDTNSGSEKNKKAKEYGALVISEAEFNEMIGKRFRDAAEIRVPAWLREIPESAFAGCDSLTSVMIPEGVTSIGECAFVNCRSLTSVTIPEGVTSIGDNAFYGCNGLTSVTIPDSVTSIGNWAFSDCSSLKSVMIPNGVTKIYQESFSDCPNLTIHAPAGSYAEQYAKENNVPFVAE